MVDERSSGPFEDVQRTNLPVSQLLVLSIHGWWVHAGTAEAIMGQDDVSPIRTQVAVIPGRLLDLPEPKSFDILLCFHRGKLCFCFSHLASLLCRDIWRDGHLSISWGAKKCSRASVRVARCVGGMRISLNPFSFGLAEKDLEWSISPC